MGFVGINIKKFLVYSIRVVFFLVVIWNGVFIIEILNKVGWSFEKIFFKYYNLDVIKIKWCVCVFLKFLWKYVLLKRNKLVINLIVVYFK